ncbi:carbohydrate ABC transporter permease [Lachnospiraceae bacterium NSJ-171]|nr:carbohydrate ABC transporter permease [Lachnospiraceae bacterium NSJ-171]
MNNENINKAVKEAGVKAASKKKKVNENGEIPVKHGKVLTAILSIITLIYISPIFVVLMNSFKANTFVKTETFAWPTGKAFVSLANYIKGFTFGNYPFFKSVLYSFVITVISTALILICTSMAAWYIARVDSIVCKIIYYLFVFSMVVPFQMVMFTLSNTADSLGLNTPWSIPIIYLGFGAGMAVFMFTGFIKGLPLEIEEAAAIDGCGPIRTFFIVIIPMLKPTLISVGILEIMWIWNDYLLPYLVLDLDKYRTIPIHIQYLQGSYGSVDLGAIMALIILSIIPVIIFYLTCQKHIIKGVAAGAVKG